jgi:queuine tRNA-ribosyltransferase
MRGRSQGEGRGFGFRISAADGRCDARRGEIRTRHGKVQTPAFMPVGTQAVVKAAGPGQVGETGTEMLLCNAFHLALRPGEEVVERLGGLHRFMGWKGSILTDSGGYQVFSLSKLRRVTEGGAEFRSPADGSVLFLSPERATEIQNMLGGDVIVAFDECVEYPCEHGYAKAAMERTLGWAERCKQAHSRDDQALFGIVQGSVYEDLRKYCSRELVRMGFDGYAIGGLSVGEGPKLMMEALEYSIGELPQDKPRYLMGVGLPRDILEAVQRGVDMFDCVLPTRNGRNGYAFTWKGVVRLRNRRHREDRSPIDETCDCDGCRNFSRGYMRHLFNAGEILGLTLVSLHNIRFFQRLMVAIREAIEGRCFLEFKDEFLGRYEEN